MQISCRGVRASSSFTTKSEALTWAATEENKIRSGQVPEGAVRPKKRRPIAILKEDTTPLVSKKELLATARDVFLGSGIYFLLKAEEIIYVGQSTNVFLRIASHLGTRDFDSWTFLPCKKEDLRRKEARYIEEFKPAGNYTGRDEYLEEEAGGDGINHEAGEGMASADLCEGGARL